MCLILDHLECPEKHIAEECKVRISRQLCCTNASSRRHFSNELEEAKKAGDGRRDIWELGITRNSDDRQRSVCPAGCAGHLVTTLMAERLPPEPLVLAQLGTLPQEKQTAAVFKWLTDCESFLSDSTADELSIHQQALINAFLDLLSVPSPTLGRVLRACLGRSLSDIFERGDRKPLFETVSTLLVKIAQFRVDKDTRQKQYSPYPEYYTRG